MLKNSIFLILFFLLSINSHSQDISVATIQNHILLVEQSKTLQENTRKELLLFYNEAKNNLKNIEDLEKQIQILEKSINDAPAKVKEIKEKVKNISRKKLVVGEISFAELEKNIKKVELELTRQKTEDGNIQKEIAHRNEQRKRIPKLIVTLEQELQDIETKLSKEKVIESALSLLFARYIAMQSKQKFLKQQLVLYKKEIMLYDVEGEFLNIKRKYLLQNIQYMEQSKKKWSEILNKKRYKEAQLEEQKAQQALLKDIGNDKILSSIKKENAAFARKRTRLAKKIEKVTIQQEDIRKRLDKLQKDFYLVRSKTKMLGMTNGIGILLRKKRRDLPDIQHYRSIILHHQEEILKVQIKIIEMEEIANELVNIPDRVKTLLEGIKGNEKIKRNIEDELHEQLKSKNSHISLLLRDYNTYFIKLIELESSEQQFIDSVTEYRSYVDERILWIRSTQSYKLHDMLKGIKSFAVFCSIQKIYRSLKLFQKDLFKHLFLFFSFGIVFIAMFACRPIWHQKLMALAPLINRAKTDEFILTLKAFFFTILIALPLPLFLFLISWRLNNIVDTSGFLRLIAGGLNIVAVVLSLLTFVRALCLKKGLGEVHFRWDVEAMLLLRKYLLFCMVFFLPMLFLVVFCGHEEGLSNTFGRLAFIVGFSSLTFFLYKTLRPTGNIHETMFDKETGKRTYATFFYLTLLLPILLVVFAWIGYYFTALNIAEKLWESVLFLFIVSFSYAMLKRWLTYTRLRLAVLKIEKNTGMEKNTEIEKNTDATSSNENEKTPDQQPVETKPQEKKINTSEFNITLTIQQLKKFLRITTYIISIIGLFYIWAEILPALKIFNHIALWSSASRNVMLSDVIIATIIGILTVIIAKNIPIMLEVSVLRRLQVDKGLRFAIITISRYILLLFGVIIGFNMLGISWAKVQWLAAAFTVGLGFGLQEIFANFISGIILLFERPIRLGDVITIDDTTGTVTKIKIRATTITNWDRKELIVPNKAFITGKLLNWSLSDTLLRIVIKVGVAYGTDPHKVQSLLLEVAKDTKHVLDDPKPKSVFNAFGDNALQFDLRIFISNIDYYLKVIHDLHIAIDETFKREGIVIAFPQRVIHIEQGQATAAKIIDKS